MMTRYSANTLLKFTSLYLIRWMKFWGVSIASEQKRRSVLQAQLSEMAILEESVPFSLKMTSGGQELRPARFAFVSNLKSTLFHLLEEKQR